MELNKNICLLCFATNVTAFSIEYTRLQKICEVLSITKIQSVPHSVCYVCYKRLVQCEQLIKQLQESNTEHNQNQEKPLVRLSAEKNYAEILPDDVYTFYVPIVKQEQLVKEGSDAALKLSSRAECERDKASSTGLSQHCEEKKVEAVTGEKEQSVDQHPSSTKKGIPYGSCDICNEKFSLYSNLRRHIEKHLGVNCFTCEVCSEKFTRHCDLKKHVKAHDEVKIFSCHVCGKEFTKSCYMKKHVKVSHDTKDFGCDVCHRRFTYRCNLREHKKVHSGVRPHRCTVCGKQFLTKGNLRTHADTHGASEKPFSCPVCSKSFAKEVYLAKHVKRHGGEQPFGCVTCSKRYRKKQDLVKHMRAHESTD